jgi:hypothetical protein
VNFVRGGGLRVIRMRGIFLGLFLMDPLGLMIDLDVLGRLPCG